MEIYLRGAVGSNYVYHLFDVLGVVHENITRFTPGIYLHMKWCIWQNRITDSADDFIYILYDLYGRVELGRLHDFSLILP